MGEVFGVFDYEGAAIQEAPSRRLVEQTALSKAKDVATQKMSPQIAVVGIAAQLPGGSWAESNLDYHEFFDFLLAKGEGYSTIPTDRLNLQYNRGKAVGQVLADTGSFLKDLELFDHMEFGITAKDAKLMPVGLRKLIEVTFLALCDSGIEYRGKNVGCYMSSVGHDLFSISGHDDTEASGSFAYIPCQVANRVSYHLDLRGPSLPLDTACSSTLYTTHFAVQALHNHECDAAVVGGAQINQRFTEWLTYTQGGIMSPDGKCKPFDVSANGFGRGEGVATIVLKNLDDAIRDNDHIYGTILGTGINSSGALVPANAPSAVAQKEAMWRAFKQAERKPQEVDFLELHATGTAQGDPTEANWVGEAFKRNDELLVGSVKGNVGHLEITAFLASLCKVCGIFETGLIPPNVNFSKPNPAIKWKQHRLRVPVEAEPIKCRSPSGKPLVAMTSSGIGGANGHAVIEGPPPPNKVESFWVEGVDVPTLLVAGGLSPRSSEELGKSLVNSLEDVTQKTELAKLFGRRARSMTWRSFGVGTATKSPNFSKATLTPKAKPPIVFVFSGQGTQYWQMARELFKVSKPFHDTILELDATYAAVVGKSIIESTGLFVEIPEDSKDPLGDPWPIAIMLPALTMVQIALIDALAAVGISPNAVIGHSAGETAVLYASGAASKTAALELSIARGRALSVVEEAHGTMAAVNCSPEEAQTFIDETHAELGKEGVLSVGCFNTPGAVTLSGLESHIDLAVAKATAAGIFARKLRTKVPVHCDMMKLCQTEFEKFVGEVFERHEVSKPKIETYSTKTGGSFNGKFDAKYYWDGTVGPVRFTEAIQTMMMRYRSATFVELGPHPVLTSYLQNMTEERDNITITCPLRRPRKGEQPAEAFEFLTAIGKVVAAGHNCVNFDKLYASSERYTGALPKYPFAVKNIPWYVVSPETTRQRQPRNGPMNYPQLAINVKSHPGLKDHIIKGEPIMPAAGFIEMALEFGASELYDVEFSSMFALSAEKPSPVQVKLDGTHWTVSSSTSTDYTKSWPINYNRLHSSGFLSKEPIKDRGLAPLDIEGIRKSFKAVDMSNFYGEFASFAQFGEMYRRIKKCYLYTGKNGAVECLTEIRARDDDIPNFADYRIHPAVLDSAIHVLVNPRMTGNYDPNLYHLPSKIGAFRLCPEFEKRPFPATIYTHATFVSWSPSSIVYNFTITNEQGVPLILIEKMEIALHGQRPKSVAQRFDVFHKSSELSITAAVPNGEANGDAPKNASLVVSYVRGEELKIQEAIKAFDSLENLTLVLIAENGYNGDACLGFARALRKEFPVWTIRVGVFDASYTQHQREEAAKKIIAFSTQDCEFHIKADGSIDVPRIEAADPPAPGAPLSNEKRWKLEKGQLVQTFMPTAPEDHVLVRVSRISSHHGSSWVFVGSVDGLSHQVVGISSGPVSSHVVVHRRSIVLAEPDTFSKDDTPVGPPIFASTLVASLVGPLAFANPHRLRGKRFLVCEKDDELRTQIHDVCAGLGMHVISVPTLSGAALEECYEQKPSFILSGTRDANEIALFRTVLAPRGEISLWAHPTEGLSAFIASDPWAVGDALQHAIKRRGQLSIPYPSLSSLLVDIPSNSARSSDIFDPKKAYVLVGGIGSLGLPIAQWMYENGAREIVLTSRSGERSLEHRNDYIAQRILGYLRNRSDVTISLVSADATSAEDMSKVIRDLSRPLGGAMLLSAILSDGTFASHTADSFERAFPSKVDAFRALENAADLKSLDFVIAFSSVSGMFGNPGQTNYAAANIAVAGMAHKYPNAFSLVAPMITDSSVLVMSEDAHYRTRVRHVAKWGMTARELCDYIGDGILKLRDGPVWQYIPDFDWRAVRDNVGFSTLYEHLVPVDSSENADEEKDSHGSLVEIVCRVLDLKESEITLNVPLTTYGLDSLSAAALSYSLRPLLSISQLQLLADLSVQDLQNRIDKAAA